MRPPSERSELVRECLDALDALAAAETVLRGQLGALRASAVAIHRYLDAGGRSQGLSDVIDITGQRAASGDALRGVESARVVVQHAIYRLAAADGMSAADIGRVWGVSRQLVSRVLNQAGEDSATG
jgi:hypothetical protein